MSVWWKIDYTRSQDKDVSQLQVRERERDVCCIDGSGHTEYYYFFFILCFVQTENGATL